MAAHAVIATQHRAAEWHRARLRVQLCFEMYDIDKSGSISMAEMKKVFRAMNLTLSVAERERRCSRSPPDPTNTL